MPNPSRPAYRLPEQFPTLPEHAATTRCHHCSWVWMNGQFRIKFINRVCAEHARYLEAP